MTGLDKPASSRNLVILNQAANYLTVGFANAFNRKFGSVTLITGSVHVQGEELDADVELRYINRWHETPVRKKTGSYILAIIRIWWLLMTRYRRHEVLFVSVPPMGYLLNLVLSHRFSMVIWDIYPDVFKVTGMRESHPVFRIWAWLNRCSFRKAYRLFTISEVMADSLSKYVDQDRLIVQPIWAIFEGDERIPREQNLFLKKHKIGDKFIVQYSGNIGLTHNVELLIDVAGSLEGNEDILFQIIGRGPREQALRRKVKKRGLDNVQMLPFQSDEMFPHSLSAANLGVVVLDERVSQGSVPSKTYNLMSFGIPALYVASNDSQLAQYSRQFEHARCFDQGQQQDISEFILELSSRSDMQVRMGMAARNAAANFTRANAERFVDAYLAQEA